MLNSTKGLIAMKTISWSDSTKFSFLWGSEVAVCYYSADNNRTLLVSYHLPDVRQELEQWLGSQTEQIEEVYNEQHIED